MKMLKTLRFCAALMTAAAAVPVTPMTVFAEDEAPTSGTCGENLTWSYDAATKTLTISGTGDMEDFPMGGPMDTGFGIYRKETINIIIEDGVTSIGNWAFYSLNNVENISIPKSVNSLGRAWFSGESPWINAKRNESPLLIVNNILSFAIKAAEWDGTIPENVTTIGEDGLYFAEGDVIIPENVTKISKNAFGSNPSNNCRSITILNPECEIYDAENTIANDMQFSIDADNEVKVIYIFNGTIRGYDNSTTQAYAEKYGYTFESLSAAPEKPPLKPTKLGDIDLSNIVDVSDAVILARYLVGDDSITIPDQGLANADADGSGKLSTEDVNYIIKMIVGLV